MKTYNLKVIEADEGKKLTDGTDFVEIVLLPKERTEDEFDEISEEEYQAIMEAEVEADDRDF